MNDQLFNLPASTKPFRLLVKQRSDRIIDYFLLAYFILGLVFATFYDTWLIGFGVGGLSIIAYYSAKLALPKSALYQYVLSIVLGIFMAQFIFQTHGMFEMHFFAFIGSALLIIYQKWKLQLPMLVFVTVHHTILSYLQDIGFKKVYFSQLQYFDFHTFLVHIFLTLIIFFICGLCAFELHKYHQMQIFQTLQMADLQKEAQLSVERKKIVKVMEERNTILESITDAFFAVDKQWIVTYWNSMAEIVLNKSKSKVISKNLWEIYPEYVNSLSYVRYLQAVNTNQAVHFEDYYVKLDSWFAISAYPSNNGLSVYFKNITESKQQVESIKESRQKYSDLFNLSPLPMWVVNLDSLTFLDVNQATLDLYGYTRDEFLLLSLKDIRPVANIPMLIKEIADSADKPDTFRNHIMIHKKKDGSLMSVELEIAPYKNQDARTSIVIASNITDKVAYIKAIEDQNKKLLSISWMHSHVIRAPLARMMGLMILMKAPKLESVEMAQLIDYLEISANELDLVIKNINAEANIIQIEKRADD